MQKPLLLLLAFLIVILLVTAMDKMPADRSGNPGLALLFYFLVLLISIISLLTGIYRVIKGKRSFPSFLHIILSIIVFALSYYLVINQR